MTNLVDKKAYSKEEQIKKWKRNLRSKEEGFYEWRIWEGTEKRVIGWEYIRVEREDKNLDFENQTLEHSLGSTAMVVGVHIT